MHSLWDPVSCLHFIPSALELPLKDLKQQGSCTDSTWNFLKELLYLSFHKNLPIIFYIVDTCYKTICLQVIIIYVLQLRTPGLEAE